MSIGWVIAKLRPGNCASTARKLFSSASLLAACHSSRGNNCRNMSVSLRPIGSMPISSEPLRETTRTSSGIAAIKALSTSCTIRVVVSRLMEGMDSSWIIRSPSSRVGMKVLPTKGNSSVVTTSKLAASTSNMRGLSRAAASKGRYSAVSLRLSQGSSCSSLLIRNEATTGITVSENTSEPSNANTMVIVTGPNNLPSSPCNDSKGRNTIMIMMMPAVTGTATSFTARKIICRRGSGCFCLAVIAIADTMFSTITIDESTSMPMAITKPPRLIRLADMSSIFIMMNVKSADKGSTTATVNAALTLPRNKPSRITTSTTASSSACATVLTAPAINTLRS